MPTAIWPKARRKRQWRVTRCRLIESGSSSRARDGGVPGEARGAIGAEITAAVEFALSSPCPTSPSCAAMCSPRRYPHECYASADIEAGEYHSGGQTLRWMRLCGRPQRHPLGEDIADEQAGGIVGVTRVCRRSTARAGSIHSDLRTSHHRAAIGAAIVGMRPVAEIMLMNFTTVAMDMIVNHRQSCVHVRRPDSRAHHYPDHDGRRFWHGRATCRLPGSVVCTYRGHQGGCSVFTG